MFADINIWSELSRDEQAALLERPALVNDRTIRRQASRIIATVRRDGDAALFDYARQFEVLIVADDAARPAFVAADLLSQAEHGEDSQALLITTSRRVADETINQVADQLTTLTRQCIARSALRRSHVILTSDIDTAIDISNRYAPEHLILQVDNARDLLDRVRNAGSVFLGNWTPESVGDYCSGTNHVLPTYGTARSYSGLGVEQFMRWMTVQELTRDGLLSLAPTVLELAAMEGLDAHAQAVRMRLGCPADVEQMQ